MTIGAFLLAATFANPVLPADFSDIDCIRSARRTNRTKAVSLSTTRGTGSYSLTTDMDDRTGLFTYNESEDAGTAIFTY